MAPTTTSVSSPIVPSNEEMTIARESSRRLARYLEFNLKVRTPEGDTIELPASAVRMLVTLLNEMASGNAIALIPVHAELTTQQAADLLGVSRPFLIKQLSEGKIPCRKVGTHRRILFKDILDFKGQIDAQRLKSLEELTRQAQELNMGY